MEKKLKVLIADNSSQFAKACQNELETQGYDVSVIENDGAKVLEIVKKHNIDVILMDVFMVNEDALMYLSIIKHIQWKSRLFPFYRQSAVKNLKSKLCLPGQIISLLNL